MCGFCGTFGGHRHWGAGAATAARPAAMRRRVAHFTSELAKQTGVRITAWGDGYQLVGPTGRRELAPDLSALWVGIDRLGRNEPDPLDPDLLARLEGDRDA